MTGINVNRGPTVSSEDWGEEEQEVKVLWEKKVLV